MTYTYRKCYICGCPVKVNIILASMKEGEPVFCPSCKEDTKRKEEEKQEVLNG